MEILLRSVREIRLQYEHELFDLKMSELAGLKGTETIEKHLEAARQSLREAEEEVRRLTQG